MQAAGEDGEEHEAREPEPGGAHAGEVAKQLGEEHAVGAHRRGDEGVEGIAFAFVGDAGGGAHAEHDEGKAADAGAGNAEPDVHGFAELFEGGPTSAATKDIVSLEFIREKIAEDPDP